MTWGRLALACGELDLRKVRRSITARQFLFWRAFDIVEGISGPQRKLAALLAWTQFDGQKVSPGDALDFVERFLADPHEERDEEPTQDEEDVEALGKKIMAMFGHPEVKQPTEND